MMQVAVHQVIGMIAVRDGLVTASGAVLMALFVAATVVLGRAARGVGGIDGQDMLLNLAALVVVQVAVVQVIDVVFVLNGCVAAAGAVLMRMVVVMARHTNLLHA
jgi:hypothetical protein